MFEKCDPISSYDRALCEVNQYNAKKQTVEFDSGQKRIFLMMIISTGGQIQYRGDS